MFQSCTLDVAALKGAVRGGDADKSGVHVRVKQLSGGGLLRAFDLSHEDPLCLIRLKELAFSAPVSRAVFEWLYFGHPLKDDIRVFVVEYGGEIVAATTRLPALILVHGAACPAYFNIDSMVNPAYRRKGWMRELYVFAQEQLGGRSLRFSKGSSPQIYPLLHTIGHRDITPNTYLVSYPSAARWLMTRLHLRVPPSTHPAAVPAGFEDYRSVDRFGPEFDSFFRRVAQGFPLLFDRDAAFMSWRYSTPPHRRYQVFERVAGGRVEELIVLSIDGDQGRIVDVLWDPAAGVGPARSIRFAQAFFDGRRAVRVLCFATHQELRRSLLECGFLDRGETPRFSAHLPPEIEAEFSLGGAHVVDGDGDTEFS